MPSVLGIVDIPAHTIRHHSDRSSNSMSPSANTKKAMGRGCSSKLDGVLYDSNLSIFGMVSKKVPNWTPDDAEGKLLGELLRNGDQYDQCKGGKTADETEERGTSDTSSIAPCMSTRVKFLHTVLIFGTFLGFGLCRGVYGPTLVELRHVTGASLTQISMLFTCLGVGGIAGGLTFGRLFDLINPLVLFVVANAAIALVTAIIPWLRVLTMMMVACATHSLIYSGLAIGCNVTLFRLWGESSKQIFLAMQLLFTVGGFVAPLLAEPFLTRVAENDIDANATLLLQSNISGSKQLANVQSYSGNGSTSVVSDDLDVSHLTNSTSLETPFVSETTRVELTLHPRFSKIVYTYLIIAVYLLLVSVCMFCLLIYMRNVRTGTYWRSTSHNRGPNPCKGGPSLYRLIATVLFMVFNVNFGGQETVYSGLLFSFAVEHAGFTPSRGTLLVSMLFTAHTFGRLAVVVVSHWVPNALYWLLTSMVGCALSCLLLAHIATSSVPAMWAAAVIGGLSISTIYSMGLLWAKEFVPLTASFTSLYTIAYTVGMMLWPPLTSYFMKNLGATWFGYMNLILLIAYSACVAALLLLKRCKNRFAMCDNVDVSDMEVQVHTKKPLDDLLAHSIHSLHTV